MVRHRAVYECPNEEPDEEPNELAFCRAPADDRFMFTSNQNELFTLSQTIFCTLESSVTICEIAERTGYLAR